MDELVSTSERRGAPVVRRSKVSNIQRLCDVVTEEWRSILEVICEDLVTSRPKRWKALVENSGSKTKH